MLLTDEERRRFADYLLVDADSCEQVAKQLEGLPGPALTALVKQERQNAAAARHVAARLLKGESMTIGTKEPT